MGAACRLEIWVGVHAPLPTGAVDEIVLPRLDWALSRPSHVTKHGRDVLLSHKVRARHVWAEQHPTPAVICSVHTRNRGVCHWHGAVDAYVALTVHAKVGVNLHDYLLLGDTESIQMRFYTHTHTHTQTQEHKHIHAHIHARSQSAYKCHPMLLSHV